MTLLSIDRFWECVRLHRPMLSDGAMGSELIGRGIAADSVLQANLSDPSSVRNLHEAYIAAGSQLITTNTFGISPASHWAEACRTGAQIAMEVAAASRYEIGVWFSLPSFAVTGDLDSVRSVVDLAALRPLFLLVETCTSLKEARAAAIAARTLRPDLLAVTAHFSAEDKLRDGTAPEEFAMALQGEGVDVLGANCGEWPEAFLELTERMWQVTLAPLLIQPSAGLPQQDVEGRWRYPVTSTRFGQTAAQLADAGATILGGCCGASPEYISAVSSRLKISE